jgi:hypothetical protein
LNRPLNVSIIKEIEEERGRDFEWQEEGGLKE